MVINADGEHFEHGLSRSLHDARDIIEDLRSHVTRGWEVDNILTERTCIRIQYRRDLAHTDHGSSWTFQTALTAR